MAKALLFNLNAMVAVFGVTRFCRTIVKWRVFRKKNFGGRSQELNLPGTAGGPNWI